MNGRIFLSVAIGLSIAEAWSCAPNVCDFGVPSADFEIDGARVPRAGEIRTLELTITAGGKRARKTYQAGPTLADGETSLRVVFDDMPGDSLDLQVSVTALSERGETIAHAGGNFTAVREGCNRHRLELAAVEEPIADAGIGGEDASAPDALAADAEPSAAPDAGPPATHDSGMPAAPDAEPADSGAIDTGRPDTGPADTGPADSGVNTPDPCPIADSDTVALYSFDNDNMGRINDERNVHDGDLRGTGASYVPGPPGCGDALRFPHSSQMTPYGYVANSTDWDLLEGSLQLWMMIDDPPPFTQRRGVIARDADNFNRGAFSLRASCDGTLVAKLETPDGNAYYQCSDLPVSAGDWSHVAINFGTAGFELWIDGVHQTSRQGSFGLIGDFCTQLITCGTSTDVGIDGNNYPWVFGGDTVNAMPGYATPLEAPLRGGAIDHVRVSRRRYP